MSMKRADQRVSSCRKVGATALSLNGLGLTELPESLAKLENLESL